MESLAWELWLGNFGLGTLAYNFEFRTLNFSLVMLIQKQFMISHTNFQISDSILSFVGESTGGDLTALQVVGIE